MANLAQPVEFSFILNTIGIIVVFAIVGVILVKKYKK
jgi:preprotein translocase subunit SecG